MPNNVLTITGLNAGYGRRRVITGLTLPAILPGHVTALVGPNAAGKSTLLRALAGLVAATGIIRFGDFDLAGLSSAERAKHVSYMPQVLPGGAALTVLESVIAALKASPIEIPNRNAATTAYATLERFDIGALALDPLDSLSGGQRQLVSLAQAVVRDPPLLLLDEPTSALDLRHQFHVMDIARALARSGRIVVVVLHDLNLAAQFADRVIILGKGLVRADGPPVQALTTEVLNEVYGVMARIEYGSNGRLQIAIDGIAGNHDSAA